MTAHARRGDGRVARIQHLLAIVSALLSMALADSLRAADAPRTVTLDDHGTGSDRRIVLQNAFVKAVIRPSQGGRVESFVHLRTNTDLTQPLGETHPGGLLSDGLWQQDYPTGEWLRATYEVKVLDKGPQQARVQLSAAGTLWKGITIQKVITLSSDSSALRAEYTLSADDSIDKRALPDFYFPQTLAERGTVFYPTEAGVLARPVAGEIENWSNDPTAGWSAFVGKSGTGLAATFGFAQLRQVRVTQSPQDAPGFTTMEWMLRKRAFKSGATLKTPVVLAPFAGLKEVCAAGDRCAAQLTLEGDGDKRTAKIVVASFVDGKAKLSLKIRNLATGKTIDGAQLDLTLKADALADASAPVTLPADANCAVVATISTGSGAADITFEKPVLTTGRSGTFAVAPQSAREPEASDSPTWSRFHPKNLNFDSTAIATPHRTWAIPWAGGRPRVLALMPQLHQREAVEFAQRFDVEITAPMLTDSVYYVVGDRVRSLKMEEVVANLEATCNKDYDVIISNHDAWPLLTEKARQALMAKIEAGTGLVYVQRGDAPPDLKPHVPLTHLGYDWTHGILAPMPKLSADTAPLVAALPFSAMPSIYNCNGSKPNVDAEGLPVGEVILQAFYNGQPRGLMAGVSEIGKGRFVQTFTEGSLIPGIGKIQPSNQSQVPIPPPFDYWEYQYAMIARFVYWAAKKDSPVTLSDAKATRDAVKILLKSSDDRAAVAHVTLRDYFGTILKEAKQPVQMKKGKDAAVVFEVSKEIAGACYLADLIVDGDKGVLAFGATAFPPPAPLFKSIAADQPVFAPTENASITATIDGTLPAGAIVRADLYDGAGRCVARTETPAQAQTKITLPLADVIQTVYQVRVTLMSNGATLAQGACEGYIKATRHPERYRASFWGGIGGGAPANVILDTYAMLHTFGINANFASMAPQDYDAPFLRRLNMPYNVSAGGMGVGGVTKQQAAEKPDSAGALGNAEYEKGHHDGGLKAGKAHVDDDILMYTCGDENRGPPKDVCFSKTAIASFQKWLAETQYKSIDELNKEWGTQYASFDQVMPMTEAEVKASAPQSKTFAPWLDQRNFNKWAYARLGRAITDGVREADPTALVGDSGTQESAVYGGRDYWFLSRAYTAMAAYGGTQTVEQESFNPDLIRYPWAGYSKQTPINRVQFYLRLSDRNRGISIFATPSHVNPDLTMSESGKDVRGVLTELSRGIGQALVSAEVVPDPVYLLQSPSSIAGAYITGNDGVASTATNSTIALMEDIGIRYRSVSYEQLAQAKLGELGAKTLLLSWAVALSPEQVKAIEAFVSGGGTVIADMQAGIMTSHGRMLETPALDNVFGIDRSKATLAKPANEKEIWKAAPTKGGAASALIAGAVETGIAAKGAEALWSVNGPGGGAVPIVFHNRFGKGHAYYFAADLPNAYVNADGKASDPESPAKLLTLQTLYDTILKDAGVVAHAAVCARDPKSGQLGARLPWVETRLKRSGDVRYLALIRGYGALEGQFADIPASLVLREGGAIYDVVAEKFLGEGNRLDFSLSNQTVRLFAIFSKAVAGPLKLDAPAAAKPGEKIAIKCDLGPASGSRVLHLDVLRPDGAVDYTDTGDTIVADGKPASITLPFALNDPAGKWRLRVTDIATGRAGDLQVELK